jgi:uncharacterized membrane protein YbaN (DUF454 family)
VAQSTQKNGIYKWFLIVIGWISVILGVFGIFLPLLPTTPFLLLAAACFVRSSPRFYQWLVSHPKLGKYVLHYLNGEGIPMRAKVIAIVMIWVTMSFSAWLVVPIIWGKIVLLIIGLCVSIYIYRQPTATN